MGWDGMGLGAGMGFGEKKIGKGMVMMVFESYFLERKGGKRWRKR